MITEDMVKFMEKQMKPYVAPSVVNRFALLALTAHFKLQQELENPDSELHLPSKQRAVEETINNIIFI